MGSKRDSLGDRMKGYENVTRTKLVRRMPVIIRIDGKAFHTFTKGFDKPFDSLLMDAMNRTMKYLCENIQGCMLGYTQSDEISLLLVDYQTLTTDSWFDDTVQKMCSISASMATLVFNKAWKEVVDEWGEKTFGSSWFEGGTIVILLGDVGVNYFGDFRDQEAKVILQDSNRTYFCIHGNHERRPESLATYHSDVWHGGAVYIEDEYSNLIFAQDGEVFDLEGLQTLVLGGAYSVDKWYRLQSGYHWFEDEQIPEQRRKSILKNVKQLGKVDLVLSHTCPYQWQPFDLFLSGIDQNSVDNSTEHWLAEVERNLDYRYWLFGHFHDDRLINDKSQMLFKNVIDLEFLKE